MGVLAVWRSDARGRFQISLPVNALLIPAIARSFTFDDFISAEDDDKLKAYELVDGRGLLMPEPDDWHEEMLEFLSFMFELQYRRMKLRYCIRKRNALVIDDT